MSKQDTNGEMSSSQWSIATEDKPSLVSCLRIYLTIQGISLFTEPQSPVYYGALSATWRLREASPAMRLRTEKGWWFRLCSCSRRFGIDAQIQTVIHNVLTH
jgi:hypothetical protein